MKKATAAIPNQRLKEERELRGWSQKYVAVGHRKASEVRQWLDALPD